MSKHKSTCIDWSAHGGEGYECTLDCPFREPEEEERPVFNTFELYVEAHPEGERFRTWLTHMVGEGLPIILLPGNSASPHSLMPNGYLAAWTGRYKDRADGKRHRFSDTPWYVQVNDCDDTAMKKHFATEAEAKIAFEELKLIPPFYIYDLDAFGYIPI